MRHNGEPRTSTRTMVIGYNWEMWWFRIGLGGMIPHSTATAMRILRRFILGGFFLLLSMEHGILVKAYRA